MSSKSFFAVTRKMGYLPFMGSLASIHKFLAPIVGRTELALYERQKVLVRCGLLPKAKGRGWASGGATSSPINVAWLLVSILATDNLSEVADETPALGAARIADVKPKPPFPIDATFVEAIAHSLDDPERASRITHIEAVRKTPSAAIGWFAGKRPNVEAKRTVFYREHEMSPELEFLVRSTLNGDGVTRIAREIAERGDSGNRP